jgi:hypothetical protein
METPYDIEVPDRQSYINFLELGHQDYLKNPTECENSTLYNFLQAMASYMEDIQGYYDNTNQNINADIPLWKAFADILMGAKIYE